MNSPSSAHTALCLGIVVLLTACAAPVTTKAPSIEPSAATKAAERDLAAGRRAYEEGDYKEASRQLQSALNGNLQARNRIIVHKYLAFISCAQSQFEPCRAHFRSAFELNPQFSLTPAESGHPLWGPVYREVAADDAAKRARRK
jgi:Tfp pilus assembly protein PilF